VEGAVGPTDFNQDDIYLRTAVGVGQGGWAHFDYVKMPDYRWGIFLADGPADRKIHFGDRSASPRGRKCPASSAIACAA
jgi:benzoyl-CoA 2,3-dioxygenase component B